MYKNVYKYKYYICKHFQNSPPPLENIVVRPLEL
jgi:hypothetical protein